MAEAPKPKRAPRKKKDESMVPAVEPDVVEPDLLLARATVNLQGLKRGKAANVDPSIPYIARCLDKGILVPVDPTD